MRAMARQQPRIVQRGHQRDSRRERGERAQVEVATVEVVQVYDVGRPRYQAEDAARPRVTEVLVTPQHVDHRARLGEKPCGSRRAEAPLGAEAIVSPPTDAVAMAKADDSGLRGALAPPDDEGRLEAQAPVLTMKPERDRLGAAAAIDWADLHEPTNSRHGRDGNVPAVNDATRRAGHGWHAAAESRTTSARRAVAHRLRVLTVIAAAEFKLKYAGSALGYVWSVLKPLALFTLLYLVFGRVFRLNELSEFYPVSLLIGIVLFTFFADATSLALVSIVVRDTLIRKLSFPRIIIPSSTMLTAAMTLSINMTVVGAFIAYKGITPRLEWLLTLPLLLELAAFTLGIGLLLAALFVRLRDLQQVWDLVLQLFFYATPILYPVGFLPPWVAKSSSSTRSPRSCRTSALCSSIPISLRISSRPQLRSAALGGCCRSRSRSAPCLSATSFSAGRNRGSRSGRDHYANAGDRCPACQQDVPAPARAADTPEGVLPPSASAYDLRAPATRSTTSRSTSAPVSSSA